MSKSLLIKASITASIVLIFTVLYIGVSLRSTHAIHGQDVLIDSGASSFAIAKQLKQQNIVDSAFLFRGLARLSGDARKLKSGLYHFDGNLNMFDVLNILTKGQVQQFRVTIPEGLRTDEMLHLLAKHSQTAIELWQDALTQVAGSMEYEGLFLPETYLYSKPINPQQFLQQMWRARAAIEANIAKEMNWSEAQITQNRIVASIVEKETAQPSERAWVSAAIHNRIRKRMPLQMDPTVIYGLYRTQGTFSGNLRKKDLKADTPWNTYTRRGLPLTPICNPGAESLRAAAKPADVDYLYFVADGSGGHAFSSSLEEHNKNVRQWIRIERQQ